jgi:hypothetical protein
MTSKPQIVISASRRTDIPAFYMPWFMKQIAQGFFEVVNPFNQHVSVVPATPDQVHTIVFWSKNFGPFIDEGYGRRLLDLGYHLFINFTINSDSPDLEPHVPPLNERLNQLEFLTKQFGADAVNWRFDPVCYYRIDQGGLQEKAELSLPRQTQTKLMPLRHNMSDFQTIAVAAAKLKITRCITSFMDYYPKIRRRLSSRPGFKFIDPPMAQKISTILDMESLLKDLNIRLFTCCEKNLVEALPATSLVTHSSCIPNDLLMKIYSGSLSLRKDTGQRVKIGCGCKVSVDIGSYRQQPCYHNCLFCYANPKFCHTAKRS